MFFTFIFVGRHEDNLIFIVFCSDLPLPLSHMFVSKETVEMSSDMNEQNTFILHYSLCQCVHFLLVH